MNALRPLLLIFAWLLVLLLGDALALIPRNAFTAPPLPVSSALRADPVPFADTTGDVFALVTLPLDGAYGGGEVHYGFVVRQNPWPKFDPNGLAGKRVDDGRLVWSDRDQHLVPRQVGDWDKEAKAVFDADQSRISKRGVGHNNVAHPRYNKEVSAEMAEFLNKKGVNDISGVSAKRQTELAQEFVDRLGDPNLANDSIKGFNQAVTTVSKAGIKGFRVVSVSASCRNQLCERM